MVINKLFVGVTLATFLTAIIFIYCKSGINQVDHKLIIADTNGWLYIIIL